MTTSAFDGRWIAYELGRLARGNRAWSLETFLKDWSPGDLQLAGLLLARIALGHERYGGWDAENEHRDLIAEAADEGADLLVYLAMRELTQGTTAPSRDS